MKEHNVFRDILQRGQKEFEKNNMKEFLATREQVLSECSDPLQTQELKLELASEKSKISRRSLGIRRRAIQSTAFIFASCDAYHRYTLGEKK